MVDSWDAEKEEIINKIIEKGHWFLVPLFSGLFHR